MLREILDYDYNYTPEIRMRIYSGDEWVTFEIEDDEEQHVYFDIDAEEAKELVAYLNKFIEEQEKNGN